MLDCRNGYWHIPTRPSVRTSNLYACLLGSFGHPDNPTWDWYNSFRSKFWNLLVLSWRRHNLFRRFWTTLHAAYHCSFTLPSTQLTCEISKVYFCCQKGKILGHVISESGIQPEPEKIKHVRDIPPPNSVKEVRTFIGLAGYYRRFVAGFFTLAAPQIAITKKNARFNWSEEWSTSFIKLKEILCLPCYAIQISIGYSYYRLRFRRCSCTAWRLRPWTCRGVCFPSIIAQRAQIFDHRKGGLCRCIWS